jgi:drug/metabolite transporter (DMT)-like permease
MWGSYAAISKTALNTLDAFQLQFYKYGIAACVIFIVLILSKRLKEIKTFTRKQWLILVICGVTSSSYAYFYNTALSMADENHIATVIMINYLFPIFVAVFSVPINGERLNLRKIAAIIIGFFGAAVVVTGGAGFVIDFKSLPMYLFALAAAILWGLFSGFGKKNSVPMILSTFVFVLIGFVISAILLPVNSSFVVIAGIDLMLIILWLGLTNLIISVFIWIRLLKISSSSKVAGLSLLTPFTTLLFVKIIFPKTHIGVYHVIGLALILAGIALQNIKIGEKNNDKST